jgi:hypothetical protein
MPKAAPELQRDWARGATYDAVTGIAKDLGLRARHPLRPGHAGRACQRGGRLTQDGPWTGEAGLQQRGGRVGLLRRRPCALRDRSAANPRRPARSDLPLQGNVDGEDQP